tara:strand:- start:91 stop:240 length:150 start_codon:yes stop_codon:yes gene_type:complete
LENEAQRIALTKTTTCIAGISSLVIPIALSALARSISIAMLSMSQDQEK